MTIIQFSVRFLWLLCLQVVFLDRLLLHGFLTPYVYPLVVILLPLTFPTWGAMLIGFGTGLTVDFFLNTGGMHALATLFLAYVRPVIIRAMRPPEGYDPDDRPTLDSMGVGWFIAFASIGILLHHTVYFVVEVWSFSYVWYFLKKVFITSVATLVLVLLLQLLTAARRT